MVEKKKSNRSSVFVAFVLGLAIGCLISSAVLFNFIVQYSKDTQIPVINVGITDDKDKLSGDKDGSTGNGAAGQNGSGTGNGVTGEIDYTTLKKYNPSFKVVDADKTWEAVNDINIFKIAYDNVTGDITVDGVGDKVIAPGTSNSYYFELVNDGDCGVDYSVIMNATLSNNVTSIPVEVKLSDYTGRYLVGSETTWNDVLDIKDIKEEGQLSSGNKMRYNFSWQWPFESGNDEYDTFLGNLAVNEDITLTITINTLATANVDAVGGVETGDNSQIMTYAIIAGVAGCAMLLLLFMGKKRKDDEDED